MGKSHLRPLCVARSSCWWKRARGRRSLDTALGGLMLAVDASG